jgi:hypothetical protein
LCFPAAFAAEPSTKPALTTQVERVVVAAKRAFTACRDGDEAALREAAAPMSKDHWEVLSACVAEDAASLKLSRAVFKRFPEAAKKEWPEDPDTDFAEFLKLIEHAKVTVDGRSATLALSDAPQDAQRTVVHLVSDDGGAWKVDVYAFVAGDDARLSRPGGLERIKQAPSLYRAILARLDRGEFKSVSDVKAAVEAAGLSASGPR